MFSARQGQIRTGKFKENEQDDKLCADVHHLLRSGQAGTLQLGLKRPPDFKSLCTSRKKKKKKPQNYYFVILLRSFCWELGTETFMASSL